MAAVRCGAVMAGPRPGHPRAGNRWGIGFTSAMFQPLTFVRLNRVGARVKPGHDEIGTSSPNAIPLTEGARGEAGRVVR